MLTRLRTQFGTAGLVVAILALVVAIGGTALAASALNGKQKKEVEKISKKFAGKPGAAGVQGPAGTKGDAGVPGSNGINGKDGTNGTSVTNTAIPVGNAKCEENGGAEFKVGAGTATFACNGETGFTKTLPLGETETGTVSFETVPSTPFPRFSNLSFPIPLEEALSTGNIHLIDSGQTTTECTGSFSEPAAIAAAGESVLCIYKGPIYINVSTVSPITFLPIKTGVFLNISPEDTAKPAVGIASFAVTAG